MTQSRRTLLTTGLKLGAATLATIVAAPWSRRARAASQKPVVVVELFTSQGCSSCPPAEAFMADLAQRDDVIALEFHVDYWDYIGWADPFAQAAFTARQRRYNSVFGSPYNYTPQMVIDGRAHEVGSRRSAVDARIEAATMKRMMDEQTSPPPRLVITETADGGATVTLDGTPPEAGDFEILLIGFDGEHATEVERGENRGRRLVNAQVVRSYAQIGPAWRGGAVQITLTKDQFKGDGGCAILVQNPTTGTIAAAEKMAY